MNAGSCPPLPNDVLVTLMTLACLCSELGNPSVQLWPDGNPQGEPGSLPLDVMMGSYYLTLGHHTPVESTILWLTYPFLRTTM